ncbi:hypothetical protein HDV00_001767 [Rhizophlyctis rosea]|nr:hypothetical protein HDV00_001767 [Rhizophlyctis rosea]
MYISQYSEQYTTMTTHYYRIVRVADITHTLAGAAGSLLTSTSQQLTTSTERTGLPVSLLLVGRLTSDCQDGTLPNGSSARQPPSTYFVDPTGKLPCEFTDFNLTWLDSDVCILAWSLVQPQWATLGNAKPSRTANTTNQLFPYLEVISPPASISPSHFLNTTPFYDFSSTDFDPTLPTAFPSTTPAPTLSSLYAKYNPITLALSRPTTNPDSPQFAHTSRPLLQQISTFRTITIHGRVRAKSALSHHKERKTDFFMVEIACVEGDWSHHQRNDLDPEGDDDVEHALATTFRSPILTAFVLYNDSSHSTSSILPWYEALKVGKKYLFVDLQLARLKRVDTSRAEGGENGSSFGSSGAGDGSGNSVTHTTSSDKVLRFLFGRSELIPLDGLDPGVDPPVPTTIIRKTQSKTTTPPSPPPLYQTLQPTTPPPPTHLFSYTGVITSFLNPTAGIFELDSLHHLYLTYHPLPTYGRPLRVGTTIHLHNVHLIIPRLGGGEGGGGRRRGVFVACQFSTVEVARFAGAEGEGGEMYVVERRKEVVEKWRGMNVPDLIIVAHSREVLRRRLGSRVGGVWDGGRLEWSTATVQRLLSIFGFTPYVPEIGTTLLTHDDGCSLAKWRWGGEVRSLSVREVTNFSGIATFLEECDNTLTSGWGGGREGGGYRFRTFTKSEMGYGDRDAVVCCFSGDSSGRMVIVDSSGKCLCVFPGVDVGLGSVWVLREWEVLVEWYGCTGGGGGKGGGVSVICLRVLRAECVEGVFDGPEDGLKKDLKKVVEEPKEEHAILFHIDHITPVTAKASKSSTSPTLSSYIYATIWPVRFAPSADEPKTYRARPAQPRKAYLRFSSKEDSVKWLPGLRVGEVYVLSGEGVGNLVKEKEGDVGVVVRSEMSVCSVLLRKEGEAGAEGTVDDSSPSRRQNPVTLLLSPTDHTSITTHIKTNSKPPPLTIPELYTKFPTLTFSAARLATRVVTFTGRVTSKSLRDATEKSSFIPYDTRMVAEKFGVGVGGGKVIVLRLMGRGGKSQGVDVYLDYRTMVVPVGIVVGSHVTIRRCGVKCSKGGGYYLCGVSETSVEVTARPELDVGDGDGGEEEQGKWCRLVDFYGGRKGIWRCRVTITHVQCLSIWSVCGRCGVKMRGGGRGCGNGCIAPPDDEDGAGGGVLQCRLRMFVEDGTGEGVAVSDDVGCLWGLLGREREGVERAVREWGGVEWRRDPPWFVEVEWGSGDVEGDGEESGAVGAKWFEGVVERCCGWGNEIILIGEGDVRGGGSGERGGVGGGERGNDEFPFSVRTLRHRTFKMREGESVGTVACPSLVVRVVGIEGVDVRGEGMRILEGLEAVLGKGKGRGEGKGRGGVDFVVADRV